MTASQKDKAQAYKTKHVVLLAFAGGVRAREVIGMNSAAPNSSSKRKGTGGA